MLAVGRGALLVVPAEEVGGTEGLVALSMQAEDFPALTDAFTRAGTAVLHYSPATLAGATPTSSSLTWQLAPVVAVGLAEGLLAGRRKGGQPQRPKVQG